MDLNHLRCFVAVAEDLHFGRAARRLEILPAALGRYVRQLEDDLGLQLLTRTTRNVALTEDGAALLTQARDLIATADALATRFRQRGRQNRRTLRLGAIDTAAAGLVPMLLHDFRDRHPGVTVELVEDKTIRLLPRLISGRLDLAIVRPPEHPARQLQMRPLFHESVVVALPARHALARRKTLTISALADEALIVPDRRSRPHSHDLTIKLFARAGLPPQIAQIAAEKQTIVSLVAAGLGIALVPRWTSRMAVPGVRYIPLRTPGGGGRDILPLAAAWVRGTRDATRDEMLGILATRLRRYAEEA